MVQWYAFRQSLRLVSFRFVSLRVVPLRVIALALCSAAIAASATPASARSHHGVGRHTHVRHTSHHSRRHFAYRHYRHIARASRWNAGVAQIQMRGLADANASLPSSAVSGRMALSGKFGSSDVVAEARRYIGGNPTSRGSLWCARFMNMVLERSGHHGTGSDMASSFAHYGRRISGPQIGAIAVMGRRGGGHVGVVSGIDANGNPIVVSGNYRNRVAEAPYPRGRIYAYVMPAS
jgi:uncharacterized protein (TIGR02594 family)